MVFGGVDEGHSFGLQTVLRASAEQLGKSVGTVDNVEQTAVFQKSCALRGEVDNAAVELVAGCAVCVILVQLAAGCFHIGRIAEYNAECAVIFMRKFADIRGYDGDFLRKTVDFDIFYGNFRNFFLDFKPPAFFFVFNLDSVPFKEIPF